VAAARTLKTPRVVGPCPHLTATWRRASQAGGYRLRCVACGELCGVRAETEPAPPSSLHVQFRGENGFAPFSPKGWL
jgi:hypothetical protein